MQQKIHETAIIETGAKIGSRCHIGPYCHIGSDVHLGDDNKLHSHVVIDGNTHIGNNNEFYPFSCIGMISQDLKYQKHWTCYTKIGNSNTFREYATVNAASIENESTIIGNDNLLLSYSHVAHDCVLGNKIIISADSKLAGHVQMEDHSILNAKSGVVQFVRIGQYAFVGGFNKVVKDILPFCIADGSPSVIRAVNKVGLERNGFSAEKIAIIQDAYKIIIRSGLTLNEAIKKLDIRYPDRPEVAAIIHFAQQSQAGLARPRRRSQQTK
ncbi:acyl-ACP--UDP-N-acetylglucosamine O-acyltransferase [bacterium]|nr:acyl-ACP--UDP-N-acetylglucosamine O-acyltransferase [bacterium]